MYIFVFVLIFISIVLGAIRFIIGPSIPDRIVALDTLTTILSVTFVIGSLFSNNKILLDLSFVFAALSFTSIIVISRYLEGDNL